MKKVNTKALAVLCLVASLSSGTLCFASSSDEIVSNNEEIEVSTNLEVIREDVTEEEATNDETYSEELDAASKETPSIARSVYWSVWGEISSNRPVGYSAQYNMHTVQSTYHYTRTYLGRYKGDSGRVWGWYTVKATGTYCDNSVWNVNKHYVKYGTTA